MKKTYSRIAALAAAISPQFANGRQVKKRFVGPGVMECDMGECNFSVQARLGCSDPCHTRHRAHMYAMAFEEVADVSTDYYFRGEHSNDNIAGDPCFHRHAENIDTYYPDQFVEIEKGCVARCTGCTFAPTAVITGPGLLDCHKGRCTKYTTKEFNCGKAIEAASEAYGSLHTIQGNSDTAHSLYGYEGINTDDPIKIPAGCKLDCSGCSLRNVRVREGNERSNDLIR